MDTGTEWREFILQCRISELNPSEIHTDEDYRVCTVEYEKGHAHVICPRILNNHNLIEVHIFYSDKLHCMYTRKHLDGMKFAIIGWIKYAKLHPNALEHNYKFIPDDMHLDMMDKAYRPLNVDDLLKKFNPARRHRPRRP